MERPVKASKSKFEELKKLNFIVSEARDEFEEKSKMAIYTGFRFCRFFRALQLDLSIGSGFCFRYFRKPLKVFK